RGLLESSETPLTGDGDAARKNFVPSGLKPSGSPSPTERGVPRRRGRARSRAGVSPRRAGRVLVYTERMAVRILVVNGSSNAGKSCFTRWLTKEHGFERIDIDEYEIDTKGLRDLWTKVERGDATASRDELHARVTGAVLDWP